MKRFLSYFLFQSRPEADWTRARRAGFWSWNGGWTAVSAIGIGLISLLLAVGPYSLALLRGYCERPLILVLNLAPVVALMLILYGATGRAHWAFLITALLVLGFSVGNYYKLMFRDDPLMFADLFLLKEAGNMAGKYRLFISHKLAAALLCVIAGFLFLFFLVRGRPSWKGRTACAVGGVIALAALWPVLLNARTYDVTTAYYERLNNRWSSTQQYIAHGFLYPFVHSVTDAFESPPDGYDRDKAAALLAQYEDADIPEDKKVNVVGIMLEAYNDFTRFGTPELAQDVYAVWHDLEAEGYSGNLVTNIFAGGTVDTERCFLTGYSKLTNFRSATNSYVWYFQNQGYATGGLHPCYQWFYNRLNINEYLGFGHYLFVENHFNQFVGNNVALDNVFFPEFIRDYEAATADGTPYFSFSVTYQGHGPYHASVYMWGEQGDYLVNDGRYTDAQQCIIENYFGSIADTNAHLKELTDYFRADSKPVVLVLFGDHNPWMGDGNSVYTAMGVDFNMGTAQGFLNYYSTRYIIWANDAAKEILGSDFRGEGPDIGPYFLMNQLFDLCGWKGPAYLQALNDISRRVGVVHTTGRFMENGVLTDALSPEGEQLVNDYRCLQYYRRSQFAY